MELGMVGLGKMGAPMATRLTRGGHRVVVHDLDREALATAAGVGCEAAASLDALVGALSRPRVVWVMVPAGQPTEEAISALAARLELGDVVVDGGNSYYRDSMRRAAELRKRGVLLVDAGTSGGVWGLEDGYALMVGGEPEAVAHVAPALRTLAPAPDRGWGHVGPSGAGHFVKMVHNGIEYGMMQALAEGFALLRRKEEHGLDLVQIAKIWRNGSVVRSWLLDLVERALEANPGLDGVAPVVADSGEGRWTVTEAVEQSLAAPVITMALMQRFGSREPEAFADKLLAALRHQFGGHAVPSEPGEGRA
jgi:6-phosphogluconate dehydrogenase